MRALAFLLCLGTPLPAQNPPHPPAITEPERDHQVVHAADVHMETAPMSDPDRGDEHASSDWEIWSLAPLERVWSALALGGLEKVHVHLGDGAFEGSHQGRHELFFGESFRLRVRHRDQTGLASSWSERLFDTADSSAVFPLELEDVAPIPEPLWREVGGEEVELPAAGAPGFLELGSAAGARLLRFEGRAGAGNDVDNPDALAEHVDVRVLAGGGAAPLTLPPTDLALTDGHGGDRVLYLPSLALGAGERAVLWIAENGSSYWGDESQSAPSFDQLARGAPISWQVLQPGFAVELFASGFRLPVNIAFVPDADRVSDGPWFYVSELYGSVKVVTRSGAVSDFATGLLNYDPGGAFPGSGEQGVSGIVVDPATGDVLVALLWDAGPAHYPMIQRLPSLDGGFTSTGRQTLLAMPGESQGQSHFISNLNIGPDGALYVHMGDGFDASTALDLSSFRGKVLRMDLDGNALPDNPFYDAGDGITATDYVYAYGLRNPFGGGWRLSDQRYFEVENGPARDRLAMLLPGRNLGWNGSGASMSIHATHNWQPATAPVNIVFVEPLRFGGSLFPAAKHGSAFVSLSGPTWAGGPQNNGKRIEEFRLGSDGTLIEGPTPLIRWNGPGKATICGLAAGPDGLYFTDLYKSLGWQSPTDAGANVLRVRYTGVADFAADVLAGPPPLTVRFEDRSDVPGEAAWRWRFGDGDESDQQHPVHSYLDDGVYDVRLDVTGAGGVASEQKRSHVVVGELGSGLRGEYFGDADLAQPVLERLDPDVAFNWAFGSPDASVPIDDFSVRWTGSVRPYHSELWRFQTQTDDGVRLWVDGQLLIDAWVDSAGLRSGEIFLQAGERYELRMEYYERQEWALAYLQWESASTPLQTIPSEQLYPSASPGIPPTVRRLGLFGEYFDAADLTDLVLTRSDPRLDFDWRGGSPDGALGADHFSVRWTGRLRAPRSETWTLHLTTDDGARLWLDGELLIDAWQSGPPTTRSIDVPLTAGHDHALRVEYFEATGTALARLEWESPTQPREVVPRIRLSH